ncbi:hypothetical protein BKA58DRAFT_347681, partial [Alternaria rosae]|uniref:uncharacterized protein n=1 Tax=Alternaria rosae TaxID=1187941 RepID=UPI001E8DB14B
MNESTMTESSTSPSLARPRRVRYSRDEGPDITSLPIKILVGTPSRIFFVHEALLRTNSLFFTAALKTEWKQTDANDFTLVTLPETPAETFAIWIKWLYTGRVFITTPTDISHSDSNSNSS